MNHLPNDSIFISDDIKINITYEDKLLWKKLIGELSIATSQKRGKKYEKFCKYRTKGQEAKRLDNGDEFQKALKKIKELHEKVLKHLY